MAAGDVEPPDRQIHHVHSATRVSWEEDPVSIDRATVEHVSRLAYIDLAVEEVEELASQLSSVLEHVSHLQEVDTDGVEPAGHVQSVRDVMRDDEVRPSWPPAAILANAPSREDDLFEVQAVLD
jgi:aspartyl-tRNA(Asn)/glutamyl-tRNA(Gln) amidotransferase subunit C